MKKKIAYLVVTAGLTVSAFFVGVNQNHTDGKNRLDLDDKQDFITACNLMGDIVDWNTDGKEIAVMTKDGYEFYAYKSENIYKGENE